MELIKTNIPGVVILQPRIFGDERGYFFESFSQRDFEREVRRTVFVQEIVLWGTAGITFSETTLCPVEIGAGGKRKRVGCGGGYPERIADFWKICVSGTDGGK